MARKEECSEELLSTMKLLCHSASDGGLSCTSSPVKPHDEGCNFDDEVDPVTDLLEDSDSGVFVASRYVELMTIIVQGAGGGRFCQDLESGSYRLI